MRDEAESAALRTFLGNAGLVSCELVIATLALIPVDPSLLIAAGALAESGLRALDAIHVVAAVSVPPLDAFVSYDERQAAAARLAGLRTVLPGA